MKWFSSLLLLLGVLSAGGCNSYAISNPCTHPDTLNLTDPQDGQARVQIALLLDTSSSMDGLIDQARTHLWSVVNELALAKRPGKNIVFEVALYEYGNSGLSPTNGFVRRLTPLTSDLDLVSEELFALSTGGGEEYCGVVMNTALAELDWSQNPTDYKAIFIAGNEPFNQGNCDYRKASKLAISHGIMVNTIFCGDEKEGLNSYWKDGADLADGQFMVINQNQALVNIDAPQDDQILALNQQLNTTYIAYSREGKAKKERQSLMDSMTYGKSKEAAVQRSIAKGSKAYDASWDLVEQAEEKPEMVAELEADQLPEEMKEMDNTQRRAYLKQKSQERDQLKKQLGDLRKARDAYIAKERAKSLQGKDESLGEAMIRAVRDQLKTRHFQLEEQTPKP